MGFFNKIVRVRLRETEFNKVKEYSDKLKDCDGFSMFCRIAIIKYIRECEENEFKLLRPKD